MTPAPFTNLRVSLYAAFNYAECAAWLIIAFGLPFRLRASLPEKRWVLFRASLTLVVFAVSDYLEAATEAQLPPWLWAWKILCVGYLLKCRHDFIGKERFRWFDRTHILATACLMAVVLAIFLQHKLGDFLE